MNCLILLAALTIGDVEHGEVRFQPTAAEADVPERFRLGPAVFTYELEPLRDSGRFTVSALRFPSPIVSPDPVNNTVHAEYFRPIAPNPDPTRSAGRQ